MAFTMGHEVRKAAITLENLLPAPRRLVMDSFEDMESFHPERGFQVSPRKHTWDAPPLFRCLLATTLLRRPPSPLHA